MTAKSKRSYRLSDVAVAKIEATARALGVSSTSAVEILIRQAPDHQPPDKEYRPRKASPPAPSVE